MFNSSWEVFALSEYVYGYRLYILMMYFFIILVLVADIVDSQMSKSYNLFFI